MKRLFSLFLIAFCAWQANAQTKFLQRGFGSAIASSQSDRMVGVHPSYAVGTRLLVKNTANGSGIIVKIIGTMPKTADNEKIVIRLSQAACKALNATGKRFSVELYTAPIETTETAKNPEDTTPKTPTTKAEENVVMHVVANGETLYSISKKYKIIVEDLMLWNKLEGTTLYKGQKLKILQK